MPISGSVEASESEADTCIREAREEIGVLVRPLRKIGEIDAQNAPYRLKFWLTEIMSGEPQIQNDELCELRWVSIEEWRKLRPVFEDDFRILESLK